MMVKNYKVTDTVNGTVEWFDEFDINEIEYAFGFYLDDETAEVADMLVAALRKGKSTYGLEQFLGIEVEEVWVRE